MRCNSALTQSVNASTTTEQAQRPFVPKHIYPARQCPYLPFGILPKNKFALIGFSFRSTCLLWLNNEITLFLSSRHAIQFSMKRKMSSSSGRHHEADDGDVMMIMSPPPEHIPHLLFLAFQNLYFSVKFASSHATIKRWFYQCSRVRGKHRGKFRGAIKRGRRMTQSDDCRKNRHDDVQTLLNHIAVEETTAVKRECIRRSMPLKLTISWFNNRYIGFLLICMAIQFQLVGFRVN